MELAGRLAGGARGAGAGAPADFVDFAACDLKKKRMMATVSKAAAAR